MIDIGFSEKDRKLLADALSCMLSDSVILFFKTLGFSWNIKGDNAYGFQLLFKEQATEYFDKINMIAERIRSLDYHVPGAVKEYLQFTCLHENAHYVQDPHDMLQSLVRDNEFLVRRAHDVYDIANNLHDPVTRYLMQDRMRVHSENAWKMRMHLE